ncbi:hypothetical protein ABPG77_001786 [Micractinium sp. CCAP 211/92]
MCALEAALWTRRTGGVEHSFRCRSPYNAAPCPAGALASCALHRTVHSQGHCAAFQLRQLFGQQAARQQQQAGAALVQVQAGAGLQGGTRSQREYTDTLSPLWAVGARQAHDPAACRSMPQRSVCAGAAGWRGSSACPLAPSFPPASPTCFRLSTDSKKSPSSSSAMLLAQLSRGEKGPCMAVSFKRVVPAQG